MKIEAIEIFHVRMPLKRRFETSFGVQTHHEAVIVRLASGGAWGFGEAPASSGPWYSGEDVHTAYHMIQDFLAPRIVGKEIAHPSDLWTAFKFVRGNPMAKAGVETAAWDCFAKIHGQPLSKLWGGERAEIATGVSLGIEATLPELIERVRASVAAGYQRIKIKIAPGWDVNAVRAVRTEFPDIKLMADANAAYHLRDLDTLKLLDPYGLMMIEQPLAYEDLIDHATLARAMATPICLDESIRSPDDARRAMEIGACRIVNIKQARVGGPSQAIKLHDICRTGGMPVWCGGLLETGIGRLHNVALSSLPNFTLPGDVSASERYYEEDLIDPPVVVSKQGTIRVPTGPGIGHEVRLDRVRKFSVKSAAL